MNQCMSSIPKKREVTVRIFEEKGLAPSLTEGSLTMKSGAMEDLDTVAPKGKNYSIWAQAGMARAKARGRRWRRPIVAKEQIRRRS